MLRLEAREEDWEVEARGTSLGNLNARADGDLDGKYLVLSSHQEKTPCLL